MRTVISVEIEETQDLADSSEPNLEVFDLPPKPIRSQSQTTTDINLKTKQSTPPIKFLFSVIIKNQPIGKFSPMLLKQKARCG